MSDTTYITVEDSGSHYTLVHNNYRLIANESYIPFDWNPLDLPAKTIRFQFPSGFDPTTYWSNTESYHHTGTWTQVSSDPNVWDFYRNSSDWSNTFDYPYTTSQLFNGKMLGGNLEGVTNVQYMFNNFAGDCEGAYLYMPDVTNLSSTFASGNGTTWGATWTAPYIYAPNATSTWYMFHNSTKLGNCPVFDISNVTNCEGMFAQCNSLTHVPLFDMRSCTNAYQMFSNTRSVQSGAYAMYEYASTKAIPITNHSNMFTNCGFDTVTGLAELNRIPQDWGGLQY